MHFPARMPACNAPPLAGFVAEYLHVSPIISLELLATRARHTACTGRGAPAPLPSPRPVAVARCSAAAYPPVFKPVSTHAVGRATAYFLMKAVDNIPIRADLCCAFLPTSSAAMSVLRGAGLSTRPRLVGSAGLWLGQLRRSPGDGGGR